MLSGHVLLSGSSAGNDNEFAKWSVSMSERPAKLWSRTSRSSRAASALLWGGKADEGAVLRDLTDLRSMMVNLDDTKIISKVVATIQSGPPHANTGIQRFDLLIFDVIGGSRRKIFCLDFFPASSTSLDRS